MQGLAAGSRGITVQAFLSRILFGQPYVFLLFVLLAFLARGEAVTSPLWSLDAYSIAHAGEPPYELYVSQGRYTRAALDALLNWLGLLGSGWTFAAVTAAILLHVHSGLLLAHALFRRATSAEASVFLALYVLHPFGTEFFYFSDATLTTMVSFWLTAAGLYVVMRPGSIGASGLLGGTLLLVLAMAIYQTAAAFALAFLALAIGIRLARLDEPVSTTIWQSRAARVAAVSTVSLVVYMVSVRVVAAITGVATQSRLVPRGLASDLRLEIEEAARAVEFALLPPGSITPAFATVLILLLLSLSIGLVLWRAWRTGHLGAAFVGTVVMVGTLVVAVALPTIGEGTTYLVPRLMVTVTVAVAGLVLAGWRSARAMPAKVAMATILIILAVTYIGDSNRILADQRRVNLWDAQLADRIVGRLETQPAFRDATTIAIVFTVPPYSGRVETWLGGGMNASALIVPYAQPGLVEQATGYRFERPSEADWALAREFCGSAMTWPATGSTAIVGPVAVVCLT